MPNGVTTNCGYDNNDANRLTTVNGVTYTWDNNGNLLTDGAKTYGYDQANRLKEVTQGANTYTFAYNGVGDRLSQTVGITTTRYVLDPAAGLTQVLADGTNTYLYGNSRLAQYQTAMQYYGADGLGSVRQIYDATGQVLANTRYDPYGSLMSQYGDATSVFGFTGEQYDATGLEYLRARYYSSAQGRFLTEDVWPGDSTSPMSYNAWSYVNGNLVNAVDPSGHDLMIVGGAGGDQFSGGKDPYDDPQYFKPWITSYTGMDDSVFSSWLDKWTKANDEGRKQLAQKNGIGVFNYVKAAPNSSKPAAQSAIGTAAWMLNKQIAEWDLYDVTLLGHSKGGRIVITLLSYYAQGKLVNSRVKHAIIIDAPRAEPQQKVYVPLPGGGTAVVPGIFTEGIVEWAWGGACAVTAGDAGVNAIDFPGIFPSSVTDATVIPNGLNGQWDPGGVHGNRPNWVDYSYRQLGLEGNTHSVGCTKIGCQYPISPLGTGPR